MLAAEVVEHSRVADPDRLVYYAEVRSDVGLRDVLVGVAFDLRRNGIREPFAVSVESSRRMKRCCGALHALIRPFRSCSLWTWSKAYAARASPATLRPSFAPCHLPCAGSLCSVKRARCAS